MLKAPLSIYTEDAVKKHNTIDDCWVILHSNVYDVTKYLYLHPGGENRILRKAGEDISDDFEEIFHSTIAHIEIKRYQVGVLKQAKRRKSTYDKIFIEITLTKIRKLNHNVSSFLFKLPHRLEMPLGYRIDALLPTGKDTVTGRSYTPVRCKKRRLALVVKVYPDGVLSKHIFGLKRGDVLKISPPHGTFSNQQAMEQASTVLFLAGGTGITPFFPLLRHLAKVHYQRRVSLLFWNQTKEDTFLEPELQKVVSSLQDGRVRFLTSTEYGRLSKEQLERLTDVGSLNAKSFVGICGPPAFNRVAESTLKDLEFAGVSHVFE